MKLRSAEFLLVACLVATVLAPAPAGAETPLIVGPDGDRSEEYFITTEGDRVYFEQAYRLYRKDKRRPSHYWRALAEAGILEGIGVVWYFSNQNFNAQDWDFDNTQEALKRKFLTTEQIRFDNNTFLFNDLYHPISYMGIYIFTRANNLTIAESYFYTFMSSLLWEYVGELREKVSINDQIVSPFAGMAFGEVGYQMGEFFHSPESDGNIGAKILTGLFGVPRALHDWMDGAPGRAEDVPYDREFWHRFNLNVGMNSLQATGDTDREALEFAADLSIDSRLVSLPGYMRPGRFDVDFSDGNFTDFELRAVIGDEALHELSVYAESSFYGFYGQRITEPPEGRKGFTYLITGARAYEIIYRNHDILIDELAFVHIGPSFEFHIFERGLHISASMKAFFDFATIYAHAWHDYRDEFGPQGVRTTLTEQSYYFGVGPTLMPHLALAYGGFELGAKLRWAYFTSIDSRDRFQEQVTKDVDLNDRILDYRVWLEMPTGVDWLRTDLTYERITRRGRVERFTKRRGYRSLMLRLKYVF